MHETSGGESRRAATNWSGVGCPTGWRLGRRDSLDQREQLEILAAAIGELPDRQREVFVAIVLNDVSIDVLALELGSNRNAIYKNLFDARRSLRGRLTAAGHLVADEDGIA